MHWFCWKFQDFQWGTCVYVLSPFSQLMTNLMREEVKHTHSSSYRRWMVTVRKNRATKTKNSQKIEAEKMCLITETILKLTTLSLLMIHSPGTQAVLQGGGSYVGKVRDRVWAPVTSAITNGSPSNPSSASLALQSKGTVSTRVKSRMEQEGHSGRRKEGRKGPAVHLHTPVILIYTGCQPPGSEFTPVAGATGLFSPSLAR